MGLVGEILIAGCFKEDMPYYLTTATLIVSGNIWCKQKLALILLPWHLSLLSVAVFFCLYSGVCSESHSKPGFHVVVKWLWKLKVLYAYTTIPRKREL
jgi:hypothetical protein